MCAVAFVFGAVAAAALSAQCPDGTPPPCSTVRVPSAATPLRAGLKADPPLNDRAWIVVPFTNVTRAPDAEWLRDASVNLLYLDLSHWQDILVVDDARVADLVRQGPEARVSPLSLEAATAMARRAGAGKLVMGSFVKQGARTTLAAKLFDVRRGSLVRSAQQDLTVPDSLMAVFGRLAQGILNLSAPPGVDITNVGTSRVDAYQEYLAGTKALNRFDLAGAHPHFEQALKLDSTFALAHYKLGVVIGWESAADTLGRRAHAAAAERLSGPLPVRERSLMKAFNAFEQAQYGAACVTYATLVASDSSDVEAQYGLGECSYHNADVVVSPGKVPVFQGSWNTANRAFQRALDLDPTFHLAFQHILDALTGIIRKGVDRTVCPTDREARPSCIYQAYVRRDHDTLVTTPVLMTDSAGLAAQATDYLASGANRRNLEQAMTIAREWVAAAPDVNRAHSGLALIYSQLGDAARTEEEFSQIKGRQNDPDASKYLVGRAEALMKLGHTEQLRRLLDSAIASPDRRTDALPEQLGILTGRFGPIETLRPPRKGVAGTYASAVLRALEGGGDDVVAAAERAYLDSVRVTTSRGDTALARTPTFLGALRMRRTWPPVAASSGDHPAGIVAAVARGDTTRLRAETRWVDSAVSSRPPTVSDSGASVILADAFLFLRDSVNALRVVRRALDSIWAVTPLASTPMLNNLPVIVAWPRTALLRAELEAAAGNRDAARLWYQRFLDLWSAADPEFAPMVTRARRGLAAVVAR